MRYLWFSSEDYSFPLQVIRTHLSSEAHTTVPFKAAVPKEKVTITKKINRRLSIGRITMTKLEKIMKDRDVKKATKIKIAETIIFPTVTYGSESWTVRKKERKKFMLLSYGRGEEFYEFPGQRREQTFQFWKT